MKKILSAFVISIVTAVSLLLPFSANISGHNLSIGIGYQSASAQDTTNQPEPSFAESVASYITKGLSVWLTQQLYVLYAICALLMFIAGFILNLVIELTIVDPELLLPRTVISSLWVIFRDIANATFLFVLLYGAIQTMLGLAGAGVKKLILNVVIVAIVVNFSLFATRVAIDFSNILTLAVYNQIMGKTEKAPSKGLNPLTGDFSLKNAESKMAEMAQELGGGLSGKFISATGLLKSLTLSVDLKADIANFVTIPVKIVVYSIFLLISAAMLFSVSVVFLIRFVVVVFLMVLSPIAFVGFILPSLRSKLTSKWTDYLMNAMFFPPLFFLLTYLSLKIIDGLNKSWTVGSSNNFAIEIVSIGFSLFISGFFLMTPLLAATIFSAKGTEFMSSFTKGVSGKIKGFAGQGANIASRNTLGRGGRWMESKFKDSKFMNLAPMRDLRAATTQRLEGIKFGGGRSLEEAEKESRTTAKLQSEINDRSKFASNQANYANAKAEYDRIDRMPDKTDAEKAAKESAFETFRGTDNAKILRETREYVEGWGANDIKDNKDDIKRNSADEAIHIKDSALEAYAKTDDPEAKSFVDEIYKKKLQNLRTVLGTPGVTSDNIKKAVSGLSNEALKRLEFNELRTIMTKAGGAIKGEKLKDITKSLPPEDKKLLQADREKHFKEEAVKANGKAVASGIDVSEIENFSDNFLESNEIVPYLSPAMLQRLVNEKNTTNFLEIGKILVGIDSGTIPPTPMDTAGAAKAGAAKLLKFLRGKPVGGTFGL